MDEHDSNEVPLFDENQVPEFIEALNRAKVSHDETVTMVLAKVNVTVVKGSRQEIARGMWLCDTEPQDVHTISQGDGNLIDEAMKGCFANTDSVLKGNIPKKTGFFDIGPVEVCANGKVTIKLLSETTFTESPIKVN